MRSSRFNLAVWRPLAIASAISLVWALPSLANPAANSATPMLPFGSQLPFSQGGPADPVEADEGAIAPNSSENPSSASSNPPAGWPTAPDDEILPYPDSPSTGEASSESIDLPILPYPELETVDEVEDGAIAVADVRVDGIDGELAEVVQELVQTQAGENVTAEQLQADVAAILSTGFFADASVQVSRDFSGSVVTFVVEPVVVRSIELVGEQALTVDVVNEIFAPQLNRPIDPRLLEQRALQVDEWYFDNGYVLSQVVGLMPDPSGVVTLEVVEPTVGAIAFRFLDETGSGVDDEGDPIEGRTREDFIVRELDLQPGEVFNQTTAVEDLQTLASLGLFDDASIALDVDESVDPPVVDITYSLQERLARSFQVSGGISTELGLFGALNFSDQNFRGIGEELRFGTQVGSRGLNFSTGFTSPYRESTPNRLGYSISAFRGSSQSNTFSDEVPLPNGDDARERRFGGGVAVMRPVGEWDAELGLNYTRTSIRDSDGDLVNEDDAGNPLTLSDSGVDDLVTLGFQVTQDRRVNPLNPVGGSILSLGTEQSIPVGNGNIFMNRIRANYAQYVPVGLFGTGRVSNPEVFAFNVQGGTVLGELPPYEAFDLGGSSSVRGYREGEVGSGRTYVLATAEYRFPLFGQVGGVLFTDFATDLGSGESVLGDPAGDRDKPGTGLGYGLGVRVGSPLGLIRADFGFGIDGDSRFHFGFGQRF